MKRNIREEALAPLITLCPPLCWKWGWDLADCPTSLYSLILPSQIYTSSNFKFDHFLMNILSQLLSIEIFDTISLGALWTPTSSWRSFGLYLILLLLLCDAQRTPSDFGPCWCWDAFWTTQSVYFHFFTTKTSLFFYFLFVFWGEIMGEYAVDNYIGSRIWDLLSTIG